MAYKKIAIVINDNSDTRIITLFVPADSKESAETKIREAITSFTRTKLYQYIAEEENSKLKETFTWNDVIDYISSDMWKKYHIIIDDVIENQNIISVSPDENLLKGENKH